MMSSACDAYSVYIFNAHHHHQNATTNITITNAAITNAAITNTNSNDATVSTGAYIRGTFIWRAYIQDFTSQNNKALMLVNW